MSLLKNTTKSLMIGWSRYKYNGREGFYLNCVEEYPVSADGDSIGCSQQSISTPYAESVKVQGVKMGLFEPAIVEFVPLSVSRGGNTVLTAAEIVSITPYSEWSKVKGGVASGASGASGASVAKTENKVA